MNLRLIITWLLLFFLSSCNNSNQPSSLADEFVVNKATTSCNCRVQNTKERPQIGVKHLGPFKSKDEAIKAMCDDLDPNMEDNKKCWTTTPKDACNLFYDSAKVQATNAENFDYFEPIRAIEQPKSMDCWATALTILYSWHTNENSVEIIDVIKKYGEPYLTLFQTNAGIMPKDEEALYNKVGLQIVKGLNPSIQGWYNLLKNHGPLSITVDADPPNGTIHALVINGIKGDGTSSGTKITYVDPKDGLQHSLAFSQFIQLYEGSSNWPLQIIHWP